MSRVSHLEVRRRRFLGTERIEDVALEVPELARGSLLGGNVASASDVDDGSGSDTGRKKEGRELDQVDGLRRRGLIWEDGIGKDETNVGNEDGDSS